MWRSLLLKLTVTTSGLLLAYTAAAQTSDRAELLGRVTDKTGAVLPSVSLTLSNEATGHQHRTASNQRGDLPIPTSHPAATVSTRSSQAFRI